MSGKRQSSTVAATKSQINADGVQGVKEYTELNLHMSDKSPFPRLVEIDQIEIN